MLTATLRGVSGAVRVVVGPLKQQSDSSRILHVSSGIMLGPPWVSHHSAPASQVTKRAFAPLAFRTRSIASTSSGPVPSPLIRATFYNAGALLPGSGFNDSRPTPSVDDSEPQLGRMVLEPVYRHRGDLRA